MAESASVFELLDRDSSGYADEADVIAVLSCVIGSEEHARSALARISQEGHVDAAKLLLLLEETMPTEIRHINVAVHQKDTVRLMIAVLRHFERRATERGEFELSNQARAHANAIRTKEEQRVFSLVQREQQRERELMMTQQRRDTAEFNRAWKQRMDDFSCLASRAVEEMRTRHENSVEEVRALNFARGCSCPCVAQER